MGRQSLPADRGLPVEFRVLGDFVVLEGGKDVTPTAPKVRQILALLTLRHNQSVPVDALVDELWGPRPPAQAVRTVRTYIYELRKSLPSIKNLITTGGNGYVARIPFESLDIHRFEVLAKEGREALPAGDPVRAKEHLTSALSLWHGRVLANVERGELIEAHATQMEEMRLRALELRVDASFQLNHHHELIAELKGITATHPMHEGFYEKLMLALYRAGRRSEALEAYRELRQRLAHELGLEPGPDLRQLHRRLLEADPALNARTAFTDRLLDQPQQLTSTSKPEAASAMGANRPAQLPPDSVDFTGRQRVILQVTEMLRLGHASTGVPIVSITGMAGVGKTTTAIHCAHAIRAQFPDGQIYVPLEGSQKTVAISGEALRKILRTIGVPPDRIPETVEERMMMFRSWSSDLRLLVVLDDAASTTQVEPLLPGGAGCAVIVTSRAKLYGMRGMSGIHLDAFDVDEAAACLAKLIGSQRLEADPGSTLEIIQMVGGLPLAINFVGGRLNAMPSMSVTEFSTRLKAARNHHFGLSEMSAVGLDLCDRFDACFSKLTEHDKASLLCLARLQKLTYTTHDVAEELRMSDAAAGIVLMRLVDACLVEVVKKHAGSQCGYQLHELIRVYAKERLATQ
jgi:DNA-binding SARP family transcriptional activator